MAEIFWGWGQLPRALPCSQIKYSKNYFKRVCKKKKKKRHTSILKPSAHWQGSQGLRIKASGEENTVMATNGPHRPRLAVLHGHLLQIRDHCAPGHLVRAVASLADSHTPPAGMGKGHLVCSSSRDPRYDKGPRACFWHAQKLHSSTSGGGQGWGGSTSV